MKALLDELTKLLCVKTAQMTKKEKKKISKKISKMFSFCKSKELLYFNQEACAMIIGVNCDLHDLKDAIIFSGHIDTVIFNENVKLEQGRLYGSGASDMKSFFACVKKTLLDIGCENFKRPILVAITYDEETNNKGINAIKEFLRKKNIRAKSCIVGEPTNLGYATSSRGCYDFSISIKGKQCHTESSESVEKDAMTGLLKCIDFLRELSKNDTKTILKITRLETGKELNATKSKCSVSYQIRTITEERVHEINKQVCRYLDKQEVDFELIDHDTHLLPFENCSSTIAKKLTKERLNKVNFSASSEAGEYNMLGIDTIILGAGDLSLAHTLEENIEVEQLEKYCIILKKACLIMDQ